MSDMSAVEVIAGVLRKHIIDIKAGSDDLWFCECGHVLGSDFTDGIDMVPHLAVEVDKALGGLTREHDHTVLIDGAGRAVRLDNVARWIGGWKPEETP